MARIVPLDPRTYQRHRLHAEGRTWAETNCYSDVIIELLHGLGFEPTAALPFTLTIDFDLDQWTFFKFPAADVEELYALALHELAPWRPLTEHIHEQVQAGRPVLVELDSYFLPDTHGTAYRTAHVKSTVAVNEIDPAERRLGYFHNQSYHGLEGQDFTDVLQVDGLVHPRMMPPYIEFVKPIARARPVLPAELAEASLGLLRRQLRRVPTSNPFLAFQARMAADTPWLATAGLDAFHAYSFATLRQYGACFELAATYLAWLGEHGVDGLEEPRALLDGISTGTKAMQFQLARAMTRGRAPDLAPLARMGQDWEHAMGRLTDRFGR
jgi:hypothetical protein